MEQVKQIGIPMDDVESITKSVVSVKLEVRKFIKIFIYFFFLKDYR